MGRRDGHHGPFDRPGRRDLGHDPAHGRLSGAQARRAHHAARADIDPTEIREFLPYVVLVDIENDPLRVYYRLVGTRIAEFYGEFTGTWMHDRPISDAYRQIAENIYRTLLETKAPVYGVTEMRTRSDAMVSYEWGYFPLSNDGVNVTGGLEIESPDRRVVGVAPALADTFMRRG
ncbi:MAG: PAS domain-containing protein [Rhodospirillales bacterium]|nr:PAS domain-containing protein [Rhodospirillales bacterium]